MKVLVTGGAGFIGSAIIPELQKQIHEIVVVDDLSFGNRKFINIPDAHFFQLSILEKQKLKDTINTISPDYVIHLAAIHFIPYCNEHPFLSADINITGTLNLLDALENCNSIKKILFASTAAVYPITEAAMPETLPPGASDIYGLSKVAGEHLCNEFYLKTNIPTVICRFFNAFGLNETNPHLIPEIQRQVNSGNRKIKLGNLAPKRDYIHTTDMARAVTMLTQKFNNGIDTFNIARGIEYSVTEIVEAFEKNLGEKIQIETDPARVRKTDRLHLLADISKLKKYTGWEPLMSLEEGIKELLVKENNFKI